MLDKETLARLGEWGRYRDVDGDGIPWRTLPGTDMPAYFTRGSGHNEKGQYSERGDDYQNNLDRLVRKFQTASALVPAPEVEIAPGAPIGFIAFGSTHWAMVESRAQLRQEADLATSYLRLKAYPFTDDLAAFIDGHDRVYVVEQNRDAQMAALMRMDLIRRGWRRSAACCTTTACRSTLAASPTPCWRRKAWPSRRRPPWLRIRRTAAGVGGGGGGEGC